MSFPVFRAATASAFLAAPLLGMVTAPAPAFALTGCEPHCEAADYGNRHNSNDPTDPSKWANDNIGVGRLVESYLRSAQRYIDAKKFDSALAATQKSLSVSVTDYEKLKSDQFLVLVNTDLNDTAAAMAAADLASIPESEQADIYTNAAILADAAGHYAKAAKYARAMQALKLHDDRSQRIITRALLDETRTAKP